MSGSNYTALAQAPSGMGKGVGIPVKLLHEAEGHIVTVEMKTGESYRGVLMEAEDNWNAQMSNITVTSKDGRVKQLDSAFLRGSKIRFCILPDMLKNAPMFKRIDPKTQQLQQKGRKSKVPKK